MFRLIVFDLDGTLIDSRRDIANAANQLLRDCEAQPLADDRVGRMVGDGAATLVLRAFAASGIERPPDALERFLAIYDRRLLDHTRAYEGMPEVLGTLVARAALAVLSNKPLGATRRILAGLDLARFFPEDAVVGGDGPFPRKPDATGLRYLMTRANISHNDTLLVGDSVVDWRTARNAGSSICVARYGFGYEGFPVEELRPGDHLIDAPVELLRL